MKVPSVYVRVSSNPFSSLVLPVFPFLPGIIFLVQLSMILRKLSRLQAFIVLADLLGELVIYLVTPCCTVSCTNLSSATYGQLANMFSDYNMLLYLHNLPGSP
jgi:hypothetical protein